MLQLYTAVAALQLVEQGKISLDDHAEKYLPELGKVNVLGGFDGKLDLNEVELSNFCTGDKPILKEATTKITLRHLLTHTSGFSYDFLNKNTHKFAVTNNVPSIVSTKRSALDTPLAFEPGESLAYRPCA